MWRHEAGEISIAICDQILPPLCQFRTQRTQERTLVLFFHHLDSNITKMNQLTIVFSRAVYQHEATSLFQRNLFQGNVHGTHNNRRSDKCVCHRAKARVPELQEYSGTLKLPKRPPLRLESTGHNAHGKQGLWKVEWSCFRFLHLSWKSMQQQRENKQTISKIRLSLDMNIVPYQSCVSILVIFLDGFPVELFRLLL
jgi:hypothetical protein